MDTATKILTVLSEADVDAMTPGQLAEATGMSVSSVNAQISRLLERHILMYSGDIVTAGRYAKQYSLSDYGHSLAESEHTNLILSNEKLAYIPEQMLHKFFEVMNKLEEEIKILGESVKKELDAALEEQRAVNRALNAESIALARMNPITVAIPAVAEKSAAVAKPEDPVWLLSSYMNGEDISPIVDKLKNERTAKSWIAKRKIELNTTDFQDQPITVVNKLNQITDAALAKHGWEWS